MASKMEMLVHERKDKLVTLMPEGVRDEDKFLTKVAIDASMLCKQNSRLADCSPMSMMSGVMEAVRHGLSFANRDCYLVPYGKTAQFILGAPGIAKILYRTGLFNRIEYETVRSNDHFEYKQGSEVKLEFAKAEKNRGEVRCSYALAVMKDGTQHMYLCSHDDLMNIRNSSKNFKESDPSNPYNKWADEMFAKAPMKRLFKRLPVDPFTHGERVNQVFASIHADGGTLSEEGDFVEASYDEGTGEVFSVQG
jgi:phage RecT family recombinase